MLVSLISATYPVRYFRFLVVGLRVIAINPQLVFVSCWGQKNHPSVISKNRITLILIDVYLPVFRSGGNKEVLHCHFFPCNLYDVFIRRPLGENLFAIKLTLNHSGVGNRRYDKRQQKHTQKPIHQNLQLIIWQSNAACVFQGVSNSALMGCLC